MASSSAGSHASASSSVSMADADPITRNALRYTISAQEYQLLRQYFLSRGSAAPKSTPAASQTAAVSASSKEAKAVRDDDFSAATVRISLRLFVGAFVGLKGWDVISERALWRTPNFRLAASISSIFFFHRVFFRFFTRLRASLRTDEAKPFKKRNPRVWRALTSRLSPAVGASLAGLFLGISPADQTRVTIAIYVFSRALEFFYEHLLSRGYFPSRPWWFGSWMIMPAACGQLLHAFVFDRDCFPAAYGGFILKRSPEYIQQRPETYPTGLPWPSTFDIVDSLAEISRQKWLPFVSPILFPASKTLPAALAKIAPITDPAHPAIKNLACAVLHPHDTSCLRTWLQYYIRAFPAMAKFWTVVYALLSLPKYKVFMAMPLTALNGLAAKVLRTSFYLTSAIGTAWSTICLFQHILPRKMFPTSRWFLSGFAAGLWAFADRKDGRSGFLYSARTSIDSLWKVGKKRRWWRGVANGDVLLFTACLAMINAMYEREPRVVTTGVARKALSLARGDGWVDRAAAGAVRSRRAGHGHGSGASLTGTAPALADKKDE